MYGYLITLVSIAPSINQIESYLGSVSGVSRLLGGNALCIYGVLAGLTKLPYSLSNLSIRNPTGNANVLSIGAAAVLSWNLLTRG